MWYYGIAGRLVCLSLCVCASVVIAVSPNFPSKSENTYVTPHGAGEREAKKLCVVPTLYNVVSIRVKWTSSSQAPTADGLPLLFRGICRASTSISSSHPVLAHL